MKISREGLGKRITKLRKNKGLSQEELAKRIELSRSSVVQIEQGKRKISASELYNISVVLGFSIDRFMSKDFDLNNHKIDYFNNQNSVDEERISVPELKIDKFKNVLLYILERCAGKPNVGETLIYKLLYFSDFNYYELYEEHLTGAKYKKLPYGPVPQKLDSIITHMIDSKELKRINTEYHGYQQTRYLPLVKADLSLFKATEKDILDKVIEQFSDWNATSISDYSHKDIPWLASIEGEYIDYELVFYRESPYSVRVYNETE